MERPNRHRVMWWQVLVLLVVASGCARSRVHYEEIFRDDTVHVRLAEKLGKSGEAVPRSYEHPWDVEVEVLDAMLESVLYRKGKVVIGGKDSKEAFPDLPRLALLRHIQSAFAQAGLDQAVDFSFVYTQSSLKIFRRVYLTDGIMFRKGGQLNIAFRNLAFEQMGGEEEDNFEPNREDPNGVAHANELGPHGRRRSVPGAGDGARHPRVEYLHQLDPLGSLLAMGRRRCRDHREGYARHGRRPGVPV